MNMWKINVVVPALALSVMLTAVAFACDEKNGVIPDEKQTKLIEQFGGEGIDANKDGTLTRDEVHTFFAAKHPGKWFDGQGCRGMKGRGYRGKRGGGPGGMHRVGRMLEHIEKLSAQTPPADFDLQKFPEADLDGNGELSDSEWTAFAENARERTLERLAMRIPEADVDEDGTISEAELAALVARHRERILERHPEADTDGDGTLSDDEFEAFKANHIAERRASLLERHPEADLDGDGVLSDDEADAFQADRPEKSGKGRGWHKRGRGPGYGKASHGEGDFGKAGHGKGRGCPHGEK